MLDNGLYIFVNKVVLLNDGLMAIATVPEDIFDNLIKMKKHEIKVNPVEGCVTLNVDKVHVKLPDVVFDHVVKSSKIYIYLSRLDDYVMSPWVSGDISPAELWSVKGVADYLASGPV